MLNKDEILKRTNNGLDVFKHYIPGQWRIGRNFLNPLYEGRILTFVAFCLRLSAVRMGYELFSQPPIIQYFNKV